MKTAVLVSLVSLFLLSSFRNRAASLEKADSLIRMYDIPPVDSIRMYKGYIIGQMMLDSDVNTSLDYLERANNLMNKGVEYSTRRLSRSAVKCGLLNVLSEVYTRVGDIQKGQAFRMQQLDIARKSGEPSLEQTTLGNLAGDHERQGNFEEALKYQRMALQLALKQNDPYAIGLAYGNVGSIFGETNRLDSALFYYRKSVPFLQAIENNKDAQYGALGWMMNNLGDVFLQQGEADSAFAYYHRSREFREAIHHMLGMFLIDCDLANLHRQRKNNDSAMYYINRSIALGRANGFVEYLDNSYKVRSEIFRDEGKYKEALGDYIVSIGLRDSIVNEENGKNILRQSLMYEHRMAELADSLEYAKKEAVLTERTKKQRLGLLAAAGGLALLLALAYSIYKGKKRSDELLLNILPEETAKELKHRGSADAKLIDQVTVLFTDFKGFTAFAEKLGPQELVQDLNECFSAFDVIVEKHGLEKIKTIGDAYMAAGGLPTPNDTHAADAVRAALEMRDFIEKGKAKRTAAGLPWFEIRIGIHTGPVVAGIVGIKKFQYDIWGDTVNTASRMESSGEAGKVNVSQTTYSSVAGSFDFHYRGDIEAKGKGKMKMYFAEYKT